MSNSLLPHDGAPLPGTVDYIEAIFQLGVQTNDPELRGATPRMQSNSRFEQPWHFSGNYATAFILERNGVSHVVRCWTKSIHRADRFYAQLDQALAALRLPWLTQFRFLAEGIMVDDRWWPALRMEWLAGFPLHRFLDSIRGDAGQLRALAAAFLEMMQGLSAAGVAHGDLQSDNIMVRRNEEGGIELRLIDYDTLAVPATYGFPTDNEGLPAFQHPSRKGARRLGPKDDAFAALMIYLSVLALAEDASACPQPGEALWERYSLEHCDRDLLFCQQDFTATTPNEKFVRLRQFSPLVSRLTLILWNYLRCPREDYLPCVGEIVALAAQEQPVRDPAKAPTPEERRRREADWQRLSQTSLPSTKVRNSAWLEEWDDWPLHAAASATPSPAAAAP